MTEWYMHQYNAKDESPDSIMWQAGCDKNVLEFIIENLDKMRAFCFQICQVVTQGVAAKNSPTAQKPFPP